jgi:Flp pilus assembly protein TadG
MSSVFRPTGRRNREAGAAMVEMVFVLVPMLALIFLLVDTAWMLFARAALQEAVRQAVRFGVVGQLAPGCSGLNASIQQVLQQHSQGFVNAGNVSSVVSIRYTSPTDSTTALSGCTATIGGNVLQVSISGFALKPMAPLLRSSSPLTLAANSADVMEPGTNNCP